jgi:uracil-DNA glycosylase
MLGCRRCAGLAGSRSQVVPGDGAAPAGVMFVGIAPGRFGGDRTGIPFCGDRSGAMLRRMVERAGLQRVFITNLIRCNPRDGRGRNRDPDAAEILNCRPYLEAELALVRPRVIVCLGRMAWRHLAGPRALFDPRRPAAVEAAGALVYPMYHPGYVIRGAYPERRYARDFARLAAFAAAGYSDMNVHLAGIRPWKSPRNS